MSQDAEKIQTLLNALACGKNEAAEELFPLVYEELHRMAASFMNRERGDHTLQPTALINEVYLRLAKSPNGPSNFDAASNCFEGQRHFIASAALMMRRILVNHARQKNAAKRAGKKVFVELDQIEQSLHATQVDLLALDEALIRLQQLDPLQHQLVELRFFGGMTVDQAAEILDVSPRKLAYEWAHARAWLKKQLRDAEEPGETE